MIFLLKPNGELKEYKLGRGHDSDIRVSDISVSRCHATVKFKDNKFIIEDSCSKFGTLVMVKDRIPIVRDYT